MKLRWDKWAYGLFSGIIGGGAGAVVAGLASMLLAPQEFNVTSWHGVIKAISMMFACFTINGLISMFFFLKQSPLPPPENGDSIPRAFVNPNPPQKPPSASPGS